jgi:excisionase family DNA binding protein
MHPHLVDLVGTAQLIKASAGHTRKLVASGVIPGTRVGGQWRLWVPSVLTAVIGADAARHATPALPEDWVEPGIVTVAELAELLGLPAGTVKILLNQKCIPANKLGSRWKCYWPSIVEKIASGQPLTGVPDLLDAEPDQHHEEHV